MTLQELIAKWRARPLCARALQIIQELEAVSALAALPGDAVEAFYAAVNKRAEADMLAGRTITGAHHRALEAEIANHRAALPDTEATAACWICRNESFGSTQERERCRIHGLKASEATAPATPETPKTCPNCEQQGSSMGWQDCPSGFHWAIRSAEPVKRDEHGRPLCECGMYHPLPEQLRDDAGGESA